MLVNWLPSKLSFFIMVKFYTTYRGNDQAKNLKTVSNIFKKMSHNFPAQTTKQDTITEFKKSVPCPPVSFIMVYF